MARRALLALAILAAVHGCSQNGIPIDLTQEALLQLRSGHYDDAIKTSSQAIAEKPDSAAAYLYRGRAYHYRNAMGDPQRAIADFGESIRLAPKSSDAYYSRALVRRDLGQTDEAAADEGLARDLDSVVQETYRQLPDQTTPSEIARLRRIETPAEAAKKIKPGAGIPTSEDAQKKMYETLKDRFEPGFGELRSPTSRPAGSAAKSSASLNDRYRQLLEQNSSANSPNSATPELTQPLPQQNPADTSSDSTGAGAAPLSGPAVPSAVPKAAQPGSFARPGGAWQGPMQPPLMSPFAQRTTGNGGGQLGRAFVNPNLQSPFQQPAPGGTGFAAPVSPFSPQARQQAAPVARPFGGNTNRYSNPSVRPANPRDYVP